jgi:hypothetical protein
MAVAHDTGGPIYACFRPTRYNGDRLPAVCLTLDPRDFAAIHRETPDRSDGTTVVSAGVDGDGQPVMVYRRRGEEGSYEIAIARRRHVGGEWICESVASDPFKQLAVSNPVCDSGRQLQLAVFDPTANSIHWLTRRDNGWARERVHQFSSGEVDNAGAWVGPVARLDTAGRPVILLGQRSMNRGWLRFFQPRD